MAGTSTLDQQMAELGLKKRRMSYLFLKEMLKRISTDMSFVLLGEC